MLQLENRTPLAASLLVLPEPDGVDALHVVVAATFDLTPEGALAAAQRPVALADITVGDGARRWLLRPGASHPAKPASEVIVEGAAVAPGGAAVTALDVGFSVGDAARWLRVSGDRVYTGLPAPFCTAPAPFTRVPLTPERAFGGRFGEAGAFEPRNPVGVGAASGDLRDFDALRGAPLPNLEDPESLMASPWDRPPPRWFGAVAPWWSPRLERAGTYDDAWDRERAPLLPRDFDPRFAMATPDAMWLPAALRGGERIALRHLADAPWIESRVPSFELSVRARFRGADHTLAAQRETLHLIPGEGVGVLTLRAVLRCGHRVLDVSRVAVSLGGVA